MNTSPSIPNEKKLAHRLAINHADFSLISKQVEIGRQKEKYENVLTNEFYNLCFNNPSGDLVKRHRNILVLGAGASKSLHRDVKLGKGAADEIKQSFIASFGGNTKVEALVEEELDRLSNVYNLKRNDFETILLAISKFSKHHVVSKLKEFYENKFLTSEFYEIVGHLLKNRFIDIVINFNFDEILDEIIEEEIGNGEYYYIVSDGDCPEPDNVDRHPKEPISFESILDEERLLKPVYIKPHGTISHPSTLRFTDEDYYYIPGNINPLIRYLLDAKVPNKQDYQMDVNLIIVGFEMNSFDFNNIIRTSFEKSEDRLNIYNVNIIDKSELKFEEKKIFKNDKIHDIIIDNKFSLNVFARKLWADIDAQFKEEYKPKNIKRHLLISKVFGQQDAIAVRPADALFFQDRVYLEIMIEVLYSNGLINFTQMNECRIKKYYIIYREKYAGVLRIDEFMVKLGLIKYRNFISDTFTIPSKEISNKSVWAKKLMGRAIQCLEDPERKRRFREFLAASTTDTSLEMTDARQFLNIVPDYRERYISIFKQLEFDNFLNTEIKWKLYLKEFFTTKVKEWNLLLVTTDKGGLFANSYYKDILKKNDKKFAFVFSNYAVENGKTILQNYFTDHFGDMLQNYVYQQEDKLVSLPWRSNSQHMNIFVQADKRNGEYEFKIIGGIYYSRRLLSKRVNPLLIDNEEDKNTLFYLFLNYWERARLENKISTSEQHMLIREFTQDYKRSIEGSDKIY